MAITRQAGSGMGLTLRPLYPQNPGNITNTNPFSTYVNEVALGSGNTEVVPSGQWLVTTGLYTFVQFKDPITGIWRSLGQTPNINRFVNSDGVNVRLANLSGCALGAHITNVGSAYTSAPTVTASAGSSAWTAIVGGAINSTITITTAGAGYSHKPILLIEPPPAGGVQATAVAAVTGGAISSVTVIDQGAGYTTAPGVTIVPDPRDTVTTKGVLTTALTGSGTVTAIVCTDHGTPLTSVPTLTISGGGGSSAAATVVMCFTATGFTITNAGVAYGTSLPVLINVADGRITTAAGTVVNPSIGVGLLNPRNGSAIVISEAGGTISATPTIQDGGLYAKVPTAFFTSSNSTVASTNAVATVVVGGVTDVALLQSF